MLQIALLKEKKQQNKRKPVQLNYYRYSFDGIDILAGKNNLANDNLTFKNARSEEWWFHARNIPGSHIIVKSKAEQLDDKTVEAAAMIAAWHSKGKNNTKVEIDYTKRKNVKKPGSAAPGMVIYERHQSITVAPDAALAASLLISN